MSLAQMEPTWTLGNRLWKARAYAGFDQAEVATLVGVSRALVSRWEKDLSDPRLSQLRKFAEVTGVSFEWLVGSMTCLMTLPEPSGQIPLPFDSARPALASVSL